MRALTIQLDDKQFDALRTIAQENGLPGPENLITEQVDRLIASYCGPGVSKEIKEHIKASITENRGLLERLAK